MNQVQCVKIPIVPAGADRLRDWIAGLSERQEEIQQALASEGIISEAVFSSHEPSGEFLYIVTRAENLAAANAAFQASQLPVDVELKQLLGECLDLGSATALELLFAATAQPHSNQA